MSCVKVAIMPSAFSTPSSNGSANHSHSRSHSQSNCSMAYNRPNYGRAHAQHLHQNTWPLMTNTTAGSVVSGPPSASPFSPAVPNVRNVWNVSEIIPRLYISDLSFAENPALLASYRISHILSTLPDTIFCPPTSLLPMQPARLQIRVDDLPFSELAAHLPTTTAFIRDALLGSAEARVLVHCAEGISRSVSVVAAFLMAQYGWSPSEAVQFIKSKRRVADPNFGFVQQLHEYARDGLGRVQAPPPPPSHAVPQFSGSFPPLPPSASSSSS